MSAIEPVSIAILAKAPIPGFAKTRLIPALGAEGAASFQQSLTARAVETACAAATGPVTLWGAPDATHAAFAAVRARGIGLMQQPNGDLGARMLAALAAAKGPALVIGTDCPVLGSDDLRTAAEMLRDGTNVVLFPAEDGGYVLIGARRAEAALFADMTWSTPQVMTETRRRLREAKLSWQEPVTLWDVDRPEDLDRLRACGLGGLLP
ncbi:MAG: TIGR04282 family arsenosugar biosynthesis glycosyltransferase [Xanthobacteraceae bacterium]